MLESEKARKLLLSLTGRSECLATGAPSRHRARAAEGRKWRAEVVRRPHQGWSSRQLSGALGGRGHRGGNGHPDPSILEDAQAGFGRAAGRGDGLPEALG